MTANSMAGKHVAITGPTAGIGRYSSLELARRGAQLTLLCRNPDKAEALSNEIVAEGGSKPAVILMDMSDLSSVRAAAEQFLQDNQQLDVLLNNAGLINTQRRLSADGFEETLAVNHFAPFLLTGMLLPVLLDTPSARIVNVASAAHTFVKGMGFDDMHAERNYKTFREYGRSKLANILFTRTLAQRLKDRDITVNCLHPGTVSTSLGQQNDTILTSILPFLIRPFFKSPEGGAQTSLYLCCSDDVSQVSGKYFADEKPKKPKPWARDDAAAARLWEYTEEATQFHYSV